MQKYKSYHSGIKTCYALGIEEEVLPENFIKNIPNSTSHYWKNENPDKYLGAEFVTKIDADLDNVKLVLNENLKKINQGYFAFCRLYLTILSFIGKKQFKAIIKQNRNTVVDLIENLPDGFDKKIVCKFLKISSNSYSTWKRLKTYACSASPIGLCFKKIPHQISKAEIEILKKFMTNQKYIHWPISSIWGQAFKESKISMAISTWYRYVRILGYSQARKKPKKPRKRGSVKAEKVNQIWHMDVSHYKTIDNVKFYIYTVVDNFSKKIIAYDLSEELSAITRLKSLKQAIENAFGVTIGNQNLDLIVDGGSENNNSTIHEFIKNCQVNIDKKIALKDVVFSNSVVEGPYKIMKSLYFRGKQILSTTLQQELDFFIQDYNYNRPLGYHKIYTPDEIYQKPELKNVNPTILKANKDRIKANQQFCCKN